MIVSPDAQNQIDWSVNTNILAHLPPLPIDIVPITWMPSFKFKGGNFCNPAKWVLVDFMEPHSSNPEYDKFWAWAIENPPVLHFQRELRNDMEPPYHWKKVPIEFACYLPIPDRATKESFDARPIDVLYFWGMSHQRRPKLHGDIFREGMASKGVDVISEWNHWEDTKSKSFSQHLWLSVYTPYWRRKPMTEILPIMQQAKIIVAMPGNGKKTFRHAECVGTLMAVDADNSVWAYPWNDSNSIQLTPEMEFFDLLKATQRTDLYDLYCACDSNMRRYEARTYANEYVAAQIRQVL